MQVIQVLFILLISIHSLAAPDVCRAVKWPFADDGAKLDVGRLSKIEREHLFKYLYFEISAPTTGRVPGLAAKLFFYLKNTELNEDRYQMLMALEWAVDPSANSVPINIKDICILHDRVLRLPQSLRKAEKKK